MSCVSTRPKSPMLFAQIRAGLTALKQGVAARIGITEREPGATTAGLAGCGSQAVCVLGMHRSGTSVITRALNLLGVYLGKKKELMPATQANAKGYWERLDICQLQDRLLALLGRRWDSVEPLPADWQTKAGMEACRQELTQLITGSFASHPLWGWKDPRTCLLLPLWRSVLSELGIPLRCVIVVRNPLEVARSLEKRDQLPLANGLQLWFRHYLSAIQSAAGLPTAFVAYDQFMQSWERDLRRCAARLELPWPRRDRRLKAEMKRFLDPVLRHHQANAADLDSAPAPVLELYRTLLSAARGQEPAGMELAALARRFSEALGALPGAS